MTIVRRTLNPEEMDTALQAGGPLAEMQLSAEKLKQMRIAVVEIDGQIVAYWVVWFGLHVEPLWVAEEHRRSPAVIKNIVEQMQEEVLRTAEPAAFCIVESSEAGEVVARYADRLGFHEAPGKLYYVVVED